VDAPGVEYFEIQAGGQSVRLFRCETHLADLTPTACAARFRAARGAYRLDFSRCRHCPIGAVHAGKLAPARPASDCVRCGKWASKLVRNLLCVPCYNRQQEVLKGQDRRGRPPKAVVQFWEPAPARESGKIPQVFNFLVDVQGVGIREFIAVRPREALEQASRLFYRGVPLAMKVTNAAALGRQIPRYPGNAPQT